MVSPASDIRRSVFRVKPPSRLVRISAAAPTKEPLRHVEMTEKASGPRWSVALVVLGTNVGGSSHFIEPLSHILVTSFAEFFLVRIVSRAPCSQRYRHTPSSPRERGFAHGRADIYRTGALFCINHWGFIGKVRINTEGYAITMPWTSCDTRFSIK